MKTSDFDFDLPKELIAQFPPQERTASRLLWLDGASGALQEALFSDFPRYLRPGDLLVLNDTRVIKARLAGVKESGGQVEVLIERLLTEHQALALVRASHPPRVGSKLILAGALAATVLERRDELYLLAFDDERPLTALLERYGAVPLPPYIERQATSLDEARYQTVYARVPGAVAAPTAGLHFDQAMLERVEACGALIAWLTLHVGAGTFQPVRGEDLSRHRMHSEVFQIPEATASAISRTKRSGGRVLAVGTTSLRALEAAATEGGVKPGRGETDLFITPGYRFRVVDRLLTNFHLPRSTLLMLVAAFGGLENIRRAYRHAIEKRYRFFSYGDAMLIERGEP